MYVNERDMEKKVRNGKEKNCHCRVATRQLKALWEREKMKDEAELHDEVMEESRFLAPLLLDQ